MSPTRSCSYGQFTDKKDMRTGDRIHKLAVIKKTDPVWGLYQFKIGRIRNYL